MRLLLSKISGKDNSFPWLWSERRCTQLPYHPTLLTALPKLRIVENLHPGSLLDRQFWKPIGKLYPITEMEEEKSLDLTIDPLNQISVGMLGVKWCKNFCSDIFPFARIYPSRQRVKIIVMVTSILFGNSPLLLDRLLMAQYKHQEG